MELSGKVVVITGGGRGIGAALARTFSQSGARVAVLARTATEVQAVATDVKGIAIVADIQREADCEHAVQEILSHYGKIDLLINNAGVCMEKPLPQYTEAEYDRIMNTNVKGVFLMTKAVYAKTHPHMIISISSASGKQGFPGLSIYCASKFAVHGMMEAFAQETHAKVYTVFPGPVDTHMYRELWNEEARMKPEFVATAIAALVQEEPPTGFQLELSR